MLPSLCSSLHFTSKRSNISNSKLIIMLIKILRKQLSHLLSSVIYKVGLESERWTTDDKAEEICPVVLNDSSADRIMEQLLSVVITFHNE